MITALLAATIAAAEPAPTATTVMPHAAAQQPPSPPAHLDQVGWLVGRWIGTGIGGGTAQEHWFAPAGTTMVGTFIQQDKNGAIVFTEHLYLMEEAGSLVLRLKHFNPDLTSWEEKAKTTDFRLEKIEPCAVLFTALTIRCDGSNGMKATVRVRQTDGTFDTLDFAFKRAG